MAERGLRLILVCYIRKYVIILGEGGILVDVTPIKILGNVSPAGLTAVDARPIILAQRLRPTRIELLHDELPRCQ